MLFKTDSKVSDLNPAKVIGILNKHLGTRMVIEGVYAERTMTTNPLKVSAIEGQPLKQPVIIEIRGKVTIQGRTPYRLEGYECGEFDRTPEWVGHAQVSFGFHSFFVVTKVMEPKSK